MWYRFAWLLFLGSAAADAEINVPPGYYYEELMPRESGYSRWASINNRGEIAWATRLGGEDWNTSEIFLYRDGVIEQITNDNVRDDFPNINENGDIVWSRADGPNGVLEIVRYRDGLISRITDEAKAKTPRENFNPIVNRAGQIAWNRTTDAFCTTADAEIYFFDGEASAPISEIGLSNQLADLNDLGDVVWTEFNFCNSPWTSRIMFYSGGVVQEISNGALYPNRSSINNNRFIVWDEYNQFSDQNEIWGWRDGQQELIDDDGINGKLNNNDDVLFIRNSDTTPYRLLLHTAGTSSVVAADDVIWNIGDDINDAGEIVWHFGNFPQTAVRVVLRYRQADLNCDHAVTAADIQPFILALIDSNLYQQQYPSCDPLLADFNDDGFVTVSDIGGFVAALTMQ